LGEVFTPERYVAEMLALFDPKIWSDENVVFFEPSVGNGNIVLPILLRRIQTFQKKFERAGEGEAAKCGIATALNTIWAIDICPQNIDMTRQRMFALVLRQMIANDISLQTSKSRDFLTHVLCTLLWQVQENEALSALSGSKDAVAQAELTKLGRQWIKAHTHKPIDFKNDWCTYYQSCLSDGPTPVIYERAKRFIDLLLVAGSSRGYSEFQFARAAYVDVSENEPRKISGVA
jgi:hypothetical protein